MTEEQGNLPVELPVNTHLAFILDGEVVLINSANEEVAAIMQSTPTIIDITSMSPQPKVGDEYVNNEFILHSQNPPTGEHIIVDA
jgi:hypothetical protein